MKINIAENIKSLRKQRKMTQENIAEAFNVSIGAVSKWELGLSVPDICTIVDMASFFGVSVDALLGYQWHTNDMDETMATLKKLRNEKRFAEAASIAEKALQKWPNFFDITFKCAVFFSMKGMEEKNGKDLRKALELFNRSLELIDQNTDTQINEWTIKNYIAWIYIKQDEKEREKGIELLKQNNAAGLNNLEIGCTLSGDNKRYEEAFPYLSDAIVGNLANLVRNLDGFVEAYDRRGDYASALDACSTAVQMIGLAGKPGRVSYLVKLEVQLYTGCAMLSLKLGDEGMCREYMEKAVEKARLFDRKPCYSFENLKFIEREKGGTAFDDFGVTAMEGIANSFKNEEKYEEKLREIFSSIIGETK